jgi:hypothetical protein
MAKHRRGSSHYKRGGSRRMKMRGVKKGGSNYSSGSTYGSYVNGSVNSQFSRTFDSSGPYANRLGNEYVGAQGQWSKQPSLPSEQNLSLIQSAGSRRRRGGLFGEVVNQAVVPFGILALQQSYRKNKNGGKYTRKYRH